MLALSRKRQGLAAGAILMKQIDSTQPVTIQAMLLLSVSAGEYQTAHKI
jgi:hypothetical protein